MKALLVILFMINGEPTLIDGWYPMIVDASRCTQAAELVKEQITLDGSNIEFVVKCVSLD